MTGRRSGIRAPFDSAEIESPELELGADLSGNGFGCLPVPYPARRSLAVVRHEHPPGFSLASHFLPDDNAHGAPLFLLFG